MEIRRPLLPFTGNDDADRLLETDPNALLFGFLLDQQVTLQKAFSGPYELKQRIGTLDPGRIAAMEPAKLEEVFRERPALHRFPANMAHRTQELAAAIARDYDGDAGRIWREASSGKDLEQRLLALPGIGEMKAKTLIAHHRQALRRQTARLGRCSTAPSHACGRRIRQTHWPTTRPVNVRKKPPCAPKHLRR